ncbi:MAG: hypothetical protein H0V45_09345, partial [Actinobacteria bacterium]|nr:hypothetical protein [Actinomycetota bacterium]
MLEAVFELELTDREWRKPTHGRWVGRSDLGTLRLADDEQRGVLTEYLAMLEGPETPAQRPPWARPG